MTQFEYSPPKNAPVSTEELVKDLQMVADKLKTEKIISKPLC